MTRSLLMTAAIVAIARHWNCSRPTVLAEDVEITSGNLFPRADCRRIGPRE